MFGDESLKVCKSHEIIETNSSINGWITLDLSEGDIDDDITDENDDEGPESMKQFVEWQCPRLSEDIVNLSPGGSCRRLAESGENTWQEQEQGAGVSALLETESWSQ